MKAGKVKQESQKTAWDCPFLEVSSKVIPLPGMWPLSPTPNLLSKCHQALAKDKGKGHRESLCIHLPLSLPWMDYSGLIRPVYLLPCRNRRTKKVTKQNPKKQQKTQRRGNYLLLHNARGDSAGPQRVLIYTHTCRQSQRRARKNGGGKLQKDEKGVELSGVTKWFLSSSLRSLTKEF